MCVRRGHFVDANIGRAFRSSLEVSVDPQSETGRSALLWIVRIDTKDTMDVLIFLTRLELA
ncbi:hypothetical protein COCCADRAFT_91190 [Bipolaris zeicola 26-R-13]|uniref:Uncharacterized protein n=1 Tax=Cochliobolus carbonum (strain 26-R-13) TaxID=930089 RepID=W6YCD4_COCC2|nr:uncharacterized protein COCCADRAFT_91190 [Bipolaris zeicola 26-R-13]EUC35308.1 hypothetical protein COCCADRAFT_91190 [Bipolaris zeicola 26-R-13]